ncbi:MAG TPA: ABC transporter permease [Sphingomicrobium sp.]|nr:ABC transporter permease [Sphingomicrobium sp.]
MIPKLIRSAFVIARRDFTATVFSRAFLLFLLGPLFPVLMVVVFGVVGGAATSQAERPVVAVVASEADFQALEAARQRLGDAVQSPLLVDLHHVLPEPDADAQRARLLASKSPPVLSVLEGGLARPRLTGDVSPDGRTVRQIGFLIDDARHNVVVAPARSVEVELNRTERSPGSLGPARALTARAGQMVLFLLTILLSGMLLSQLIDEKANKIIEVLAAAVPIDAIFLGKLFAMLAMSLIGIAVWTATGAAVIAVTTGQSLAELPPPAVGWTLFVTLAVAYFMMSYLLLGSVFLGIGGQASTAREVQTLSMPVTMAQVVVFALAATAVGAPDSPHALAAAVFPLSSPLVMIARAAEQPELWPHLVAIAWQALWVALILRVAARLFRRSVLKSGPVRRRSWRRAKA